MLQIEGLTYRIGGRLLLDHAALFLPAGYHTGLVGPNGAGKSTLLRLICQELQPDGGTISLPQGLRVGKLAQEAPGGEASLLETVLEADEERSALLQEAERAEDPLRIADIHDRLTAIDAYSAPARAATILAGLGFDETAQQRPVQEFSGGWRMRVALAAILFRAPDLLLLDEPTNHLDLEATLWLESYLNKYPKSLLLVSHDRRLLNRCVGHIVHLDEGKLMLYSGGYDRFQKTRAERLSFLEGQRQKQEAARKHMQSFVDRFRYKASKARQAQSRIKAIEKMSLIEIPIERSSIRFEFEEPEPLASPIITLEKVNAGYLPDQPVLRNLSLALDADDRIAILGQNGNGKSTLMKLLSGELLPLSGSLMRSKKLRVGYFAQHQSEAFRPQDTPLAVMEEKRPRWSQQQQRSHLGSFGFGEDKIATQVTHLSGGEKARLLLALIHLDRPHILLLDEPTNHLDIDARESLLNALNGFSGAVILVSHDPHMIELAVDRLWLVEGGRCSAFDGSLDDYRAQLLGRQEGRTKTRENTNGSKSTIRPVDRRDERRKAAQFRDKTKIFRDRIAVQEKAIEALRRKQRALETKLTDEQLYHAGSADFVALTKEAHGLAVELEAAERIWLEDQLALEAVEKEFGKP